MLIRIERDMGNGEFVDLFTVGPNDMTGSLTAESRSIIFGWLKGEPGVWEGPIDEANDKLLRGFDADKITLLTRLEEPFEVTWQRNGKGLPLRFTLVES